MAEKKNNDKSKLSFEEAIKSLTEIVSKIEQGEIPLADSLEQYEKGMSLIKHCRGILKTAEKRIEKIGAEDSDGDDSDEQDGVEDKAEAESEDESLF